MSFPNLTASPDERWSVGTRLAAMLHLGKHGPHRRLQHVMSEAERKRRDSPLAGLIV